MSTLFRILVHEVVPMTRTADHVSRPLAALVLVGMLMGCGAGGVGPVGVVLCDPSIIEILSVDSNGVLGNGDSTNPAMSLFGLSVAFESFADNLVSGDTNGVKDIFVRDRLLGITERVSSGSAGEEFVGDSCNPDITGDGRYVAFDSRADAGGNPPGPQGGLPPSPACGTPGGPPANCSGVFCYDRNLGAIVRIDRAALGAPPSGRSLRPSISDDGDRVAFDSDAPDIDGILDNNNSRDVFVFVRSTGISTRASVDTSGNEGDADSWNAALSAPDGRYVAFQSAATNLVSGDTNGSMDIFVHDLQTGATVRVSVGSTGAEGNGASINPSISADGEFVAFSSDASNLVSDDTNGTRDVFVHNLMDSTTVRVTVDFFGNQGDGVSDSPSISAAGNLVSFRSDATNLSFGDTNGKSDIFLSIPAVSFIRRVNISYQGLEANGHSACPALSRYGTSVAFASIADNLVPNDQNSAEDVFLVH